MYKKIFVLIAAVLICAVTISGCTEKSTESQTSSSNPTAQSAVQSETSSAVSETNSIEEVRQLLTNLTFANKGTRANGYLMGDLDGPAYCVYSKVGYNKASFEVNLKDIKINLKRNSDSKHMNAYMFLGADIYRNKDQGWANCIDAGLVMSGGGGGWHLFHSLYSVDSSFKGNKWYESKVVLNPTHSYSIELDASKNDGEATLTAYDLTEGGKVADSITFQLQYAKKNGENVRIYQDFALDYPPNIKLDTTGNASEDWEEITLYNTDENIFMRNVRIENVKIFNTDGEHIWTEEHTAERGMWPDESNKIDYEVVKIKNPIFDSYIWFDFDMNR